MCCIAIAKSGTKKYDEFFLNSIKIASGTNTDGIGYSFKRAGNPNKVWISKGFKDVDKFISCLKAKRLKDVDELVVHLRIGNKGSKDTDMNHPFVLSNKPDEILENDSYVNAITMVHNGTFFDYAQHSSMFSDTYFFTKDFMSVKEVQDLLKRDSKLFAETFKPMLKSNRLAFIFNDKTPMVLIGEYKEDNGYFFSNDSYKRRDIINIGGETTYRNFAHGGGRAGYSEDDIDWEDLRNRSCELPVPVRQNVTTQFSRVGSSVVNTDYQRLQREKIQKQQDALKYGTKVGERVRNSQSRLEADSKFDIIPPIGAPTTLDLCMNTVLYKVMNAIYIPLHYINSQFEESKFRITSYNYKHFYFTCTTPDLDRKIYRHKCYRITNFDSSNNGMHTLHSPSMTNNPADAVYVNTHDLYRMFSIMVRQPYKDAYRTVYRLIQKYPSPSKKLFTDLDRVRRSADKKDKKDKLTFRRVEHLTLEGIKLYQNYIGDQIYDLQTAIRFRNRVQELEVWVN
jgi:archaellin